MFYCTQNQQYIQEGTAFEINDIQYPQNWLNLSTPEEKAEIGLEEVIATNQPADQTYYWVSQTLVGPDLTYTNTPKDLLSVKTTALNQINATAYSILLPTDWMVVKSVETSTPISPSWNTWRQSIRTTALNATNAVESAADVDAVEVAMNITWPKDPNQVASEAVEEMVEPVVEPVVEPTA